MDQFTLAGKRCLVGQPIRSRLTVRLGVCLLISLLTGCAGSSPSSSQRDAVPTHSASQVSGNWVAVQRGDTLGKLANRANVPLERLERFNPGVNARHLAIGQRLMIPTQQERAPSGGPYRYQIRPGDTYSNIARHFGTTSGRIQSANPGASPTALRIGQIISVPLSSGGTRSPVPSNRPASSSGTSSNTPAASPPASTSLPASARRWPWPLEDYRIVRRFGADSRGALQPMLLATQAGARAQAVAPGEVRFANGMRQLGEVVIVHHADNLQTVYALCERTLVSVGQQVKAGDELCEVGQSNTTQRYDLLFDLRQGGKPIDPSKVLR